MWNDVPGPQSIYGNSLYAIDGTTSTDVWAVGNYFDGGLNAYQPLFAHWDGTVWSPYDFSTLQVEETALGVVTITSSDVWAVGKTGHDVNYTGLFSQHWDGASWSDSVATPRQRGDLNILSSVVALSSGDVWAAGYYTTQAFTGAARTLVEHWDGASTEWTVMDTPLIGTGDTKLGGITAIQSISELWAVGSYTDPVSGALRTLALQDCPIRVGEMGFFPHQAGVSHPGAHVSFTMPSGVTPHRIVDGTGLDLYDSGLRDPPASFSYPFFSAGTYRVVDQGTGSTMTLKVPVEAFPRSGSVSTTFRLTWATHRSHGDRVFDVQILRPGSTDWADWKTGQVKGGSSFLPDSGPGTYSFRARLRSTGSGAATNYSSPVTILVS